MSSSKIEQELESFLKNDLPASVKLCRESLKWYYRTGNVEFLELTLNFAALTLPPKEVLRLKAKCVGEWFPVSDFPNMVLQG